MGFDEPKPFVYATRDFREHIRGISILQLVRLINCGLHMCLAFCQPTEAAADSMTFAICDGLEM